MFKIQGDIHQVYSIMDAITITVATWKCLIGESIQVIITAVIVIVPVVVAAIECVDVFLITHQSG